MANNLFHLDFVDNSQMTVQKFNECVEKALTELGERVRSYAVPAVPTDTGNLANSISYIVQDNKVIIGTPVFYASYIEYGTGVFADDQTKSRKGWWVFIKGHNNQTTPSGETQKVYTKEQALKIYWYLVRKAEKGEADYSTDDVWITQGNKAYHFLLDAITQHNAEYENVIRNAFTF